MEGGWKRQKPGVYCRSGANYDVIFEQAASVFVCVSECLCVYGSGQEEEEGFWSCTSFKSVMVLELTATNTKPHAH